MKISKTRFINYARCPRYCALDEIHREKERAVVAFSDDPELDEIMSEENRMRIDVIKDSMVDENQEDIIEIDDPQMEIMLPYYNQIEVLSGNIIKTRFHGDVIYSLDTYKQKRFAYANEGFEFYCFLDGYQEDQNDIRIFEVKATTSKKFTSIEYKTDDDQKQSIFGETPEGIMRLQEELGVPINADYHKKVNRLMHRMDKVGRYVYDIAYQRYVIEQALKVEKPVKYYLVVLNADYIHEGKIDENGQPIYTDDIVRFIDLTELTKRMLPTVENDVNTVKTYLEHLNASPCQLGEHCQRKDRRECKFFPICYAHVPAKNSIFTYLDGHHGFKEPDGTKHERFDLLNEGYIHASDLPYTWLNRDKNVIQRDVIETHTPYINKEKISKGIDVLKYPIYHLDFETFPCPLPRFKGERPYNQSLFQFSIHVESSPGTCDKEQNNFSFIATEHTDQREALIQSMLNVIKPDGGSVVVYNQSFEQTRLKEMAEIFPEYRERILNIIDRLFDLMDLIKGNTKLYTSLGYSKEAASGLNYYHEDLNGSYSIKKVLPVFSNLTYQGMQIGNGTEALVAYARFPDMEEKVFQDTYQSLLEYCKQDTWAMFVILDELRKLKS